MLYMSMLGKYPRYRLCALRFYFLSSPSLCRRSWNVTSARHAWQRTRTLRRQRETQSEALNLFRKRESVARDTVKQERWVQRTTTPGHWNIRAQGYIIQRARERAPKIFTPALIMPEFPIKFDNEYLNFVTLATRLPRYGRALSPWPRALKFKSLAWSWPIRT